MSQRINPWSLAGICVLCLVPFGAWLDGGEFGYVAFSEFADRRYFYLSIASLVTCTFLLLLSLFVHVRFFALLAALASFVFAVDAWNGVNMRLWNLWQRGTEYSCTNAASYCAGVAVGSSIWLWLLASILLVVGGVQTWQQWERGRSEGGSD